MADTEELWSILLPSGEVRTGTLDQLHEAFDAGCVDASTLVLAPEAKEWSTIGALAGLDDEALAPSPETLRPVAFDAALPSQESLREVPFDADDEPEPAPPPRKSRGRWIVAATAAAVAIVAAIAGAPRTTRVAKDDSPKAAAAAPIATATEITTTATEPANPIASAAPSASAQPAVGRPKTEVRGASVVPKRARPSDDPFAKRSKGKCTCAPGDPLCSCL